MRTITEQSVKVKVTVPKKDVHAKMEVFYNPLMESNRNISVLLLNSISNKNMNFALPLAGSGIRGLRFLKELKKGKIKRLCVNDRKEKFVENFNDSLKINNIKSNKVKISNDDAINFLLNQHCEEWCGYPKKSNDFSGTLKIRSSEMCFCKTHSHNFYGFDYIDLDPFGSPNPFLASSVARISRNGILAVTATDTAALTGTYGNVTKRKYWAQSLRNYLMHEIGLRILIRKVQLQGVQFDKALTPVLSYHKDHYFRIFFRSENGKEKCDKIIKQHQYLLHCSKCLNHETSQYNCGKCDCGNQFLFAGPLWAGKLFDKKLVGKMAKNNLFKEEQKFLDLLNEESKKDLVGFYDLHQIAKKHKVEAPKKDVMLKKLKAVRTHFSPTGIKTEKNVKDIVKFVRT